MDKVLLSKFKLQGIKLKVIRSESRGRSIRYLLAYVGDYKETGINGEQIVMTEGQAKYQHGKSID
ncbi:MAG: hypothetical protein Q8P40_00575 [Nitrospirota bacterium]|nr:hypothetical protein [Nitrospirota bacterium]